MTYRDELTAAQHRADALEQELAETKRQLALVKHPSASSGGETALARATRPGAVSPRWLGAPLTLTFERTVDGELPADAYGEIVDVIHLALEQTGSFTSVTGSFSWTCASNSKQALTATSVYVGSRRGTTTIRVQQKLSGLAGVLFGGIGGGVGGGAIMVPLAPVFFAPWLVAVTLPMWLGGWYWGVRRLYRRSAKRRAQTLEDLTDQIVEVAEAAIASVEQEAP